jgi:hypothetical protein
MNLRITLCTLATIPLVTASAQMFTEITSYGWGPGRQISRPAFADPDHDGLLDLFVGEDYGHLIHYQQASPGSVEFQLSTDAFCGIDVSDHSVPCFTDLDGDHLLDLIIGKENGTLDRFEQDAANSMTFILISQGFNGIEVGEQAAPCFCDLDHDGLLDLLVGEYDGNINRYEQNTAGSADFSLVSESLSGIDVGYWSAPFVVDLDNDGLWDLLSGNYKGAILHYEQDAAGSDSFALISDDIGGVKEFALATAPCVTDLEGDGLLDLIIGEENGNLNHCIQQGPNANTFSLVNANFDGAIDHCNYSAPAVCDLDKNGKLDLIVGELSQRLNRYEQEDPGSERLVFMTDFFSAISESNYISPCFTDLDNDGRLDLIVGNGNGILCHFEQDASSPGNFIKISENFNGIDVGEIASPAFTDLDSDGLLDLVVGNKEGELHHYEQEAPASSAFAPVPDSLSGIDVGGWSSPCCTDLDGDGLIDMIVGRSGPLYHFEQSGKNSTDFSLMSEDFEGIGFVHLGKPFFADINGDGREDLLIGNEDGGIRYFRRNPDTGIETNNESHPRNFRLFSNYPNPFNPSTTIPFSVKDPCRVTLKVFDILGREVRVLVDAKYPAGTHAVRFDASGLASGIYVYTIRTGDFTASRKMAVAE